MNTQIQKDAIDWRNNWEKAIEEKPYSVRYLHCVFENVVPKFALGGEFPAQTLRRLFLSEKFALQDLKSLQDFGKKGINLLLLQLGLTATNNGKFVESV